MDDQQIPDILCDVEVPRDGTSTGIPKSWIEDTGVDLSAKGLAFNVLSYPAGTVVPGTELAKLWHPDDPPVGDVLNALTAAGYLVRNNDDGRAPWRLVHPDRLGPMPTF